MKDELIKQSHIMVSKILANNIVSTEFQQRLLHHRLSSGKMGGVLRAGSAFDGTRKYRQVKGRSKKKGFTKKSQTNQTDNC